MKSFVPLIVTGLALGHAQTKGPQFERVYPLKPQEGVFAYARIAPDGNTLAYASELTAPSGRVLSQTVTVVDLKAKKVVFTDPGIDAYWSNDGSRMIYSSFSTNTVAIRHHPGGEITYNAAPMGLGDYYSWSVKDGKDLILTISSNYYNLSGDKAVLPASHVTSCPGIGVGERPMISHDGSLITTFVNGTVVVRGLADCGHTFDTGLDGAKSDFSFDGRYVAMHKARPNSALNDIVVVDLQKRTMRTITSSLPGSSLFPSWTKDGRLCFRYDGDDYRGFMMVSDVLSAPEQAMPSPSANHLTMNRTWNDVFPETKRPAHEYNLVMIWGTWSAHSAIALADLERARTYFKAQAADISVETALEPGTRRADADHILAQAGKSLPEIPLSPAHFAHTEGRNQIPTTLLFRDGKLIDRKLGPVSFEAMKDWMQSVAVVKH
ncbi:MAG TPA: hypothetical protein VE967_03480 [Gemmatimonadaceae bacterium]|nr:hypothetical protein [Gemmatimonadaceae bacterium]